MFKLNVCALNLCVTEQEELNMKLVNLSDGTAGQVATYSKIFI